ncbi:SLAM family member 9-like [Rhinoderma darwinii]|uniref:SLAM family member 9-like n=1 Tax=Rhinoderma darwinii TaxID=43563 RepID=UPI003F6781EF
MSPNVVLSEDSRSICHRQVNEEIPRLGGLCMAENGLKYRHQERSIGYNLVVVFVTKLSILDLDLSDGHINHGGEEMSSHPEYEGVQKQTLGHYRSFNGSFVRTSLSPPRSSFLNMKLQELTRRLYAPLTAVILLVLGGEANILVQKSALLHGSVTMSYSPLLKMGIINFITWRFDKNNKRTLILDTTRKPHFIYDSQFKNRLRISDNLFTLTIMDLTMEDSGVYNIDRTDTTGKVDSSTFNVTVYEPVPHPSINTEVKENTADRCDVILHCSVPSRTSDFSYTWVLSTIGIIYELHINGSTFQISRPPDQQDMEVLCIVHNPADQMNVSIQLQGICAAAGGRSLHLLIIKPVQCLLLLVPLIIYLTIILHGRRGSPKSPEYINVDRHEVTTC